MKMSSQIELESLMRGRITDRIIDHLVYKTESVISIIPEPISSHKGKLPTLREFIVKLIDYTNVYTPTLVMTLCYLNRLSLKLPPHATGMPSTRHRIFLSCLILSAKNHNDSSPLNKHWTKYTDGLFTLQDVNLMERQLLALLDWDIVIREEELLRVMEPLLNPKVSVVGSHKFGREDSMWSTLSSTSTLVNPLSQQDLNKPLREYNIVNNLKKKKFISKDNGTSNDTSNQNNNNNMKRSEKAWSFGKIMRQYGF